MALDGGGRSHVPVHTGNSGRCACRHERHSAKRSPAGQQQSFSASGACVSPPAKTVFRAAWGMYYSAPKWYITRNLAANPPEFVVSSFSNDRFDITGAHRLEQGFDRPALGTVQGTLRAIDMDARTPYTQQWNAAIQQELPSALSLTLAYVGTKGTKL